MTGPVLDNMAEDWDFLYDLSYEEFMAVVNGEQCNNNYG